MGRSIAVVCAQHGLQVVISDSSSEALSQGLEQIAKQLQGAPPPGASDHVVPVREVASDSELASADLVIEAVVESLNVKRRVCCRLEQLVKDDSILATNTSSIPVRRIAAGLSRPDRFCGMHFCHPVAKRALVELVSSDKTSAETLTRAHRYVQAIGKLPLLVKDSPGFVVNRLLFPYLNEALVLIIDGVPMRSIEDTAIAFGMPTGPLAQLDSIGIDVSLRAGHALSKAFSDRFVASELLGDLYATGRLGQKSGAGFYRYGEHVADFTFDSEVEALVRRKRGANLNLSDRDITHRLYLPMLVEATRVLEEGVVTRAEDVDLALLHGLGFHGSKRGLLRWADSVGAAQVVESLRRFGDCGKRYQPTQMLLEMANHGRGFYH
jgi:3-hydroxyacyl-CoA dehydrogenase/enoyl-CoA hydratase/3-hydroxybutyryl-CoA epimerase/3-hydroxyacyl-CoA dehydrogenase/enoyl-CoA hydratase/3-hydroxybutyryl-CoA epimerase/enoyl-CoA isomerase